MPDNILHKFRFNNNKTPQEETDLNKFKWIDMTTLKTNLISNSVSILQDGFIVNEYSPIKITVP